MRFCFLTRIHVSVIFPRLSASKVQTEIRFNPQAEAAALLAKLDEVISFFFPLLPFAIDLVVRHMMLQL